MTNSNNSTLSNINEDTVMEFVIDLWRSPLRFVKNDKTTSQEKDVARLIYDSALTDAMHATVFRDKSRPGLAGLHARLEPIKESEQWYTIIECYNLIMDGYNANPDLLKSDYNKFFPSEKVQCLATYRKRKLLKKPVC